MSPPARRVIALAALVLGAHLAGCAAWRGERPEVLLVDLQPRPGGMLEQRFAATLRVVNPNDFDLDVSGLSFRLEVNGAPLARGVSGEPFAVPRLGEAVAVVETSTTMLDLVRQALALRDGSGLAWRLAGRVHFAGPFGGSRSFDDVGTLASRPAAPGGAPLPFAAGSP